MIDTGVVGRVRDARLRAAGYRYPGSPPFGDTDVDRIVFRGREAEAEAILHSILGYDLLVVFGRSGMGKTSVLNAGVFQPLRSRGLWPVVIRLNEPGRMPLSLIAGEIETAVATAGDVEVQWRPPTVDGPPAPPTLWDLLAGMEVWTGNTLQQPVLVFDQFEELFTLDWDERVRASFIRELGDVVRRHRSHGDGGGRRAEELPPPDVKIVLVLREDSLAELEALATDIPGIMHNRFRLRGLEPSQAERAIREPALAADERLRSTRFTYSDDAAALLLGYLRSGSAGAGTPASPRIDPSQLQVLCQHVERVILPTKHADGDAPVVITPEDLGGPEGLNEILRDFYRREVDSLEPALRPRVRELCELGLLSRTGRRLSLEEGEIEDRFGVSPDVLEQLIDQRLLRAEARVGSVYYELAHDSLIAPIMTHRVERLERERVEAERDHRALQLDRWSGRLALGNLFVCGALTGPLTAVAVLALRTRRTTGERQRWKPWTGLLVAIAAMGVWAVNFDAGDVLPGGEGTFAAEDALLQLLAFAILVAQPWVGIVVGLVWPLDGERRVGRALWSVTVVATLVLALGGWLLARNVLAQIDAARDDAPGASTPFEDDTPDDTATTGLYGLRVGDCATATEIVACDTFHVYETFAIPRLGGETDPYPATTVFDDARERCLAAFEAYVGEPYADSTYEVVPWVPTEGEWQDGQRRGACMLARGGTGSARGR